MYFALSIVSDHLPDVIVDYFAIFLFYGRKQQLKLLAKTNGAAWVSLPSLGANFIKICLHVQSRRLKTFEQTRLTLFDKRVNLKFLAPEHRQSGHNTRFETLTWSSILSVFSVRTRPVRPQSYFVFPWTQIVLATVN